MIFLVVTVVFSQLSHAQASLETPAEAVAGATIEVGWTGPGENYDSVYIVAADAADDARGIHSASILSGKNPVSLTMPDETGEFEIRYWSRARKAVLARSAIGLIDIPTQLTAPDVAPIGASIEVTWEGSGNAYDTIVLVPADAAPDAKALATATVLRKNPVIVHLPESAGDFELRYRTRQNGRILTRRALSIEAVAAALHAPDAVRRGEVIEVRWDGPGNQYDRVEVHPAGAADDARAQATAGITSGKNPVIVKMPDTPGAYEYRYVTAREKHVLARRPVTVSDVETSLDAPASALAANPLQVAWIGPGNDYDRIELIDPATTDAQVLTKASILSGRSPVLLNIPDVEGRYQLRYVTTQGNSVLATRPIDIVPTGRLRVSFGRESQSSSTGAGGYGAVELILDASGSMLQRTASGERRIEIARAVLGRIVREHLADGQPFALRVFGHREVDSCRTDLEIPLGQLDRERAAGTIDAIQAKNLAKTPIADSLALIPNDLAGADGPKTIVLITDGEETCDGDPAAVITGLKQAGLDVQLSIVGFAIDEAALRESFESWALLGGGSYFDAASAEELLQSLRTVISGPYKVIDDDGKVVGEGIIGGAEIVLPVGSYRVRTAAEPARGIDDVVINARETTEVSF